MTQWVRLCDTLITQYMKPGDLFMKQCVGLCYSLMTQWVRSDGPSMTQWVIPGDL